MYSLGARPDALGTRLRLAIVALALMPLGLIRHHARAQTGYMEMLWSSDYGISDLGRTFGPDGPWQAVIARIGSNNPDSPVTWTSFWPTDQGNKTSVFSTALGGKYNKTYPLNASYNGTNYGRQFLLDPVEARSIGSIYVEQVEPMFEQEIRASVNISLTVLDSEPAYERAASRNRVGILGFGPSSSKPLTPSLLAQLKSAGHIRSESFGLHMGSVALGQKGSMVLGGYDRSRALGKIATFQRLTRNRFDSTFAVFLVDVLLGVETGASPFESLANPTSIFEGVDRNSVWSQESVRKGGRPGSLMVNLAPEWTYIGLPEAVCRAAAKRLPVAFDQRLKLYIWNTSDPRFEKIVSSPATLGFVFSDQETQNVTIKVPFRLLNLRLEAPLVNGTSLQYFPCRPIEAEDARAGVYLGRAFFQAAFWGVNCERDTAFLAQAPGPNLGQAIVRTIPPDATTIPTTEYGAFTRTWEGYWTPLPVADPSPGHERPPLATGAIAGIAVGGAAAAVLAMAAAGMFLRRRRRAAAALASGGGDKTQTGDGVGALLAASQEQGPAELHRESLMPEVGEPPSHETDGRGIRRYFELPAGAGQAQGLERGSA